MSDGKCPDIYECRMKPGDWRTFGNMLLQVENKVLKEKLSVAIKILRDVAEGDGGEPEYVTEQQTAAHTALIYLEESPAGTVNGDK